MTSLNEADTRAKLIDPKLKLSGWGESQIVREHFFRKGVNLTPGRIDKLSKHVEKLEPLVNPTGLNISVTSLRQIQKVFSDGDIDEDLDPVQCSGQEFLELLHISAKEAFGLEYYFDQNFSGDIPESIEGVSTETFQKLKQIFKWPR